jgi:hypothetical protein
MSNDFVIQVGGSPSNVRMVISWRRQWYVDGTRLFQNQTLGVLVAEWGKVLGRQTGLWSTAAKVCGIVLTAA